MSYVSFTVAELLAFLLLTAALLYLSFAIYKNVRDAGNSAAPFADDFQYFSGRNRFAAVVFCALRRELFCSPISERMELEVGKAGKAELIALIEHMRDRAKDSANIAPREFDGYCEFGNFAGMASLISMGYETLSQEYGFLTSTYAPVKASRPGGCSPLSACPASTFRLRASALSCRTARTSPSFSRWPTKRRTGWQSPRRTRRTSSHFWPAVRTRTAVWRIPATLWRIFTASTRFIKWMRTARARSSPALTTISRRTSRSKTKTSDGTTACFKIGNQVNDGYLKSYGQAAGSASYGLMVDLLLAEYSK